ncbi:MAG: hypothetical protein AAGI46_15470 [Planctomycetota bacterium]
MSLLRNRPPDLHDAKQRGTFARVGRYLLLILTLRCEDADEMRLRRRYGETHWAEDAAEVLHRWTCGTCRKSKRQEEAVESALQGFAAREQAGGPSGDGPRL